jgi:AmmeMemoRadiSam system protein B
MATEQPFANMFASRAPSKIRPAVAAGRFYPAGAEQLRALIGELLADTPPHKGPSPKALIVPHAGYTYSGTTAAAGYASLVPDRDVIRRVILLGPSHFVPVNGLAVSRAEAFRTPLGDVPIDVEQINRIMSLPQVCELDAAHAQEHSLEVHLPFLQMILGKFSIVPLVAGEVSAEQVAEVLDQLWDGAETRLLISSDLSHYHDSQTARVLDQATATAIEGLNGEAVAEDAACGQIPICGLLRAARQHGLRAHTLALRNSADTGGPSERVVGYGAFALG